jgi:hypothetical protein
VCVKCLKRRASILRQVSKTREFVFGGGTPPPGFILPAINAQTPRRSAFNRSFVFTSEEREMKDLRSVIFLCLLVGVCISSLIIGLLMPIAYLMGIIDTPYLFS